MQHCVRLKFWLCCQGPSDVANGRKTLTCMRAELPLPLITIPKQPRASGAWEQPTPDAITSCNHTFRQKTHYWWLNADLLTRTHRQVFLSAAEVRHEGLLLTLFAAVQLEEETVFACQPAVCRGVWSCWSTWSLVVTPGSDLSPPCWSYREKCKVMTRFFVRNNNVCEAVTLLYFVWTFVVKVTLQILLITGGLLLNPLSLSIWWTSECIMYISWVACYRHC